MVSLGLSILSEMVGFATLTITHLSPHTNTHTLHIHVRVSEFAPTEEEKWVSEFEQRMKSSRDLSNVAKEMTDTVTDPSIQATEVCYDGH